MDEEDLETKGARKKESIVNVLEEVNVSAFLDSWGPWSVMQVYNPDINMQGVIVIDNIVLGPGYGRIKIAPTLTPRQVFSTARTMTWMSSLMGVNFGGAAAGIRAEPDTIDKCSFVRSLARKVSPYVPDRFICAPGGGIGCDEIRAFVDEIGDVQGATGKPADMNGIPYELGVIGLGMGIAVETCVEHAASERGLPKDVPSTRVAVQGLGTEGASVAKYLHSKGARIVGLSDGACSILSPKKGIDVNKVLKLQQTGAQKSPLRHYRAADIHQESDILEADCDVLVLTKDCTAILEERTPKLRAKCIVEGCTNNLSSLCEQLLKRKNIFVLPDLIAMAGGVISSYLEMNRVGPEIAFSTIDKKVREVTRKVLSVSDQETIPFRRVAVEMAKERITKAMEATH